MSKTASDSLFRLIKSMTKSEKRYFKIYLQRNTGSNETNYAILFDAVEIQKEYNESKMLRKFEGDPMTHNFSVVKRRLYDAILKSLDSYHSESSVETELKRQLHYAEIVFRKTLYSECAKILESAKRTAIKFEKYLILLEIFKWEKKLLEKDSYAGKNEEDILAILEEDKLILDRLKSYSEYWNVKSRVFLLLNKRGKVRDSSELKDFKKIIDNTLLKTASLAHSYETRYLFHHIYSAYYFGIGDSLNSYKNIKKHIELIERHSEMFEEEPNKYFAVLTNMIYLCNQLRRYDEVQSYLDKLKTISSKISGGKNEDMEVKFFSSVYSVELTLYVNTGEFEKGIKLVPEIDAGLKKFGDKVAKLREAYFYFFISVLYFASGKHSLALQWINKLLNDKKIEESQDIHCFAQILNLIIHFELGNDDLLPYAIKSTERYLQTRKRVYKFETIFLGLISHLSKASSNKAGADYLLSFQKELTKISRDSFEKTVFEYFDFISWTESQLEKIPFADVVKRKAGKKPQREILIEG